MVKAAKKKSKDEGINSRLALVMKSGRYSLGYRTTLKSLRSGKGACTSCMPKVFPLPAAAC